MRSVDALRQALKRRKEELGKLGTLPKTTQELVDQGVPDLFLHTFAGEPFLR